MSSQARDESDKKDEKLADELIQRFEDYILHDRRISREGSARLRNRLKETLLMLLRGQRR